MADNTLPKDNNSMDPVESDPLGDLLDADDLDEFADLDEELDEPGAAATPRPYFFPEYLTINLLPYDLRKAFEALINPLYEQYVLNAPDALERSTGASLAYLMMLEVAQQTAMGNQVLSALRGGRAPDASELAGLMRTLQAKERLGKHLMRCQEFRMRWACDQSEISES